MTLLTISVSFRSFQLLDSDSLFASPISCGSRYSVPASPKSTKIKVLPMFSLALTKIPSLGSMSPVRWERMDIIVLIFSPGFMLFVRLVPVRGNGGFPAKRQEFKVEWSAVDAVDTEADRVHCSSVSAGDPANGHFPGYVAAIRADEDYRWILSSLHFLWTLFRPF
jgi:hypothetical protein